MSDEQLPWGIRVEEANDGCWIIYNADQTYWWAPSRREWAKEDPQDRMVTGIYNKRSDAVNDARSVSPPPTRDPSSDPTLREAIAVMRAMRERISADGLWEDEELLRRAFVSITDLELLCK